MSSLVPGVSSDFISSHMTAFSNYYPTPHWLTSDSTSSFAALLSQNSTVSSSFQTFSNATPPWLI
jgi:hypothetical protein